MESTFISCYLDWTLAFGAIGFDETASVIDRLCFFNIPR